MNDFTSKLPINIKGLYNLHSADEQMEKCLSEKNRQIEELTQEVWKVKEECKIIKINVDVLKFGIKNVFTIFYVIEEIFKTRVNIYHLKIVYLYCFRFYILKHHDINNIPFPPCDSIKIKLIYNIHVLIIE